MIDFRETTVMIIVTYKKGCTNCTCVLNITLIKQVLITPEDWGHFCRKRWTEIWCTYTITTTLHMCTPRSDRDCPVVKQYISYVILWLLLITRENLSRRVHMAIYMVCVWIIAQLNIGCSCWRPPIVINPLMCKTCPWTVKGWNNASHRKV